MIARLLPLVAAEWRHHPWRHAVAALAVALGVALAWSVHLINASALGEFSGALRSVNGEPDAVLRASREGLDEALLDVVAAHPAVEVANPVLEVETYAEGADGRRVAVRVVGVDVLTALRLTPDLVARPEEGSGARLAALDPDRIFANAAARQRLALTRGDGGPRLSLQAGTSVVRPRLSGDVAAGGPPLLVMDIAGAQAAFDRAGRLSRIDLRLAPGATASALHALLPPGVDIESPQAAGQRMSNLSRAYRVNLTVLALVALFVGSFLVYSVVSLSVAQRVPQLALLGVLGLTRAERHRLVLADSALLGAAGSAIGLALGTGLALAALRWLAGDLGSGHFAASGVAPQLLVQPWAVAVFGALGVAAAIAGAWVPAQQAGRIQPAQALKGLGGPAHRDRGPGLGLGLCAAGAGLALLPPVAGLPLAAYASVAAWLCGGIALVPWAVDGLLRAWPRPRAALPLLALQRARFQRHTATAAVSGVVASLALSVALTVMVGSFRDGVARWLDSVLPADLYARTAQSSALAEQAWLPAGFAAQVGAIPGVRRVEAARSRVLSLEAGRPPVTLLARELGDPARSLPMTGPPLPPRPGEIGVYVSEAMVDLYGARPGSTLRLPLGARDASSPEAGATAAGGPGAGGPGAGGEDGRTPVRVLGVWRDYARQFGTVAIDAATYRALTGDTRINDLAMWLEPGAPMSPVQQALRDATPGRQLLDFASTAELRRLSLAIFDRSFAVTGYLQAVAIAIGLVGIGASLSAQVLARRKEFGLLAHLGITRRQVVALVAWEAAAWLAAGCLVGLALGAVISVVLVHVVNPQSFHWTMDIVWPPGRLAALAALVMAAGVATAAFSARRAAAAPAVQSVKEDW